MTETEVIMRNRNKQITLWLTEKEYAELKALVAKTNLSMQAYLRAVINGIQPKERVPMNLIETLKGIQRINNNLNQIAKRMNATGHVYDADVKQVKELMNEVWQSQKSMLSKQPYLKQ